MGGSIIFGVEINAPSQVQMEQEDDESGESEIQLYHDEDTWYAGFMLKHDYMFGMSEIFSMSALREIESDIFNYIRQHNLSAISVEGVITGVSV